MNLCEVDVASPDLSCIPGYDYDIYHDISGKFGNKEWCVVGTLWVPTLVKPQLVRRLYQAREKEQYWGNVHYRELPVSFDDYIGAKARVAREWFDIYRKFSGPIRFAAYAINRASPLYDPMRYSRHFQEQNFWSLRTFLWGYSDFTSKDSIVRVTSHVESRPIAPAKRDGIHGDNFPEYFSRWGPVRAAKIQLYEPLRVLSISREYKNRVVLVDAELIQLCDLLTGATRNAICAASHIKTKSYFAVEMAKLMLESRTSKRLAQYLKVWYFPNWKGQTYKNGPLLVLNDKVGSLIER